MKRLYISLIVIGSFILFHYILPVIADEIGIESRFVYALLRFLSFVAIPLFMYKAVEFIDSISHIAISLFLVAFGFLLIESAGYSPNAFYSFFLGFFFLVMMLSSLYLFVVGLTLEPTFYFKRRVGIYLSLTAVLLILKYSGLMGIAYMVIYDYSITGGVNWDVTQILLIIEDIIFVIYFLLQYLTLDGLLAERDKYI